MDFGEGRITNCQDFMNLADIQYKQIVSSGDGQFKGSITTVTEDIVAMMATSRKRKSPPSNDFDPEKTTKSQKKDGPPFVSHYQDSKGSKYKVGDKKEFDGRTYFFCDCPFHRNRLRWHTHPADTCRTRARWLKKKEEGTIEVKDEPSANVSEENAAYNASAVSDSETSADTSLHLI